MIIRAKKILVLSIFILLFVIPANTSALVIKKEYPKLANYFLKWSIADYEVAELAKWDVLILDMEVQENSRSNLKQIRELNPDIIILAYITSQEANADIYNSPWSYNASLRKKLLNGIDDAWWLRDKNNNRITFWEGTYMLNLSNGAKNNSAGKKWNDYLPEFINCEVISTGLWDGIMYDNIWGDVAWVKEGIDIESNGQIKSTTEINNKWAEGTKKMLDTTRRLIGPNYLILGNGKVYDGYQNSLNGVMFEGFPASWEGNGVWSNIITTYSNIKKTNNTPNLTIINSGNGNNKNYQAVRFGLTSTLMENHGYFSFDFGSSDHSQVWWYDEYNINLGQAQTNAYNLLDKGNYTYKNGLWRRDFSEGIVLVNSSDKEQLYVFNNEEFEKINGTQDRSINNGSIINFIKIKPRDGVILLKREKSFSVIRNTGFNNGDFVRVFNAEGGQPRSGFFAYLDNFPSNSQIIITDIDNDKQDESLVNSRGIISLYKNGTKIKEFKPYDGKFVGEISLAVADLDGDGTKEIITGAGQGGGPHVRVFNKDGKPLIGGFFAYDQKFRGGVKVAVMDLDGDGTQEIITAAGIGGGPHIRVFSKDGRPLIGGFFAYDQKFRGGVSLAVGDVNGNGQKEIITAPNSGNSSEIKIFNKDGKFLKTFQSYEDAPKSGLRVMTDDLDNDGIFEILVGSINF
ncbi:MAG: putative glycoside hydrolase [Patescibacteria group bacterium]|nr:putative glycoside hydrolase [Patescibacteria group bacterium]